MHPDRLFVSPLLSEIELLRVRLPMIEPFVASHGVETERDVVLVHLIGETGDGWGECSTLSEPTYNAEYTDRAWEVLREDIAPRVLDNVGSFVDPDRSNPMAWCGVEVALADLGVDSPFEIAGRTPAGRSAVESTCVLGQVDSSDALRDRVVRSLSDGYRSLKLKVGPGHDVEPLTVVRGLAPDVRLAADANGSYRSADLSAISELERFHLAYLEQPFAAADLEAHAAARVRTSVPIALDESVGSLDDLSSVAEAEAAEVINIKPARLGGLAAAHRVAMEAVEHGLHVFVGGMLETGVGRSAALRLASLPLFELPTDLGPSGRYFLDDITEPIEFASPGHVAIPDDGSLVRRPRPDRLAEVTTDRVVIHR